MRKIIMLGGLLALALAGCGQSSPSAPAATQPASAPVATAVAAPTAAPPSAATAAPYPAPSVATAAPSAATAAPYPAPSSGDTSVRPPDALLNAAHDQLAQHLGVSGDKVTLQSANHKDWPDGALGCPQDGMAYPQIVTPGFLLIFMAGSQTYEVHTGMSDGQLILCQNKLPVDLSIAPSQPLPTPTAVPAAAAPAAAPTAAASPADHARQALATALGIPLADVTVVATEEMAWNDSSLGCPKPNVNYMQVITPGYKITLEAGGKRYEYHTDRGRIVVSCDKL